MTVNYALNKRFTFHNVSKQYIRQFSVFALVSASGLIVNVSVVFGAVPYFRYTICTQR